MFDALRRLNLSCDRTTDVLTEMGILVDDRRSCFEDWLDGKLDGIAPGIARETETWLRTLRNSGPRREPRNIGTVWQYARIVRPVLLDWSQWHDHLREISREDVPAVLDVLHGTARQSTLIGLRSLFGFCKKNGIVFRNPTSRIRVGNRVSKLIQPLGHSQIQQTVTNATRPDDSLILALTAIHAARAGAVRALQLDDIDLGEQRLTIAGRTRPLDELTHRIYVEWLDYRRTRWPNTANPHILINQMTAMETGRSADTGSTPDFAARTSPWNSCAWTDNSKKHLPTALTRSTSQSCSTSTLRPPSATRTRPGSYCKPRSSATLRVEPNPRVDPWS